MNKFIRNHQWITAPNAQGISFFGITKFSKQYFLRLQRLDHEQYFKTNYGINYRYWIDEFLQQRKMSTNLNLSEKMQYERFMIKQDEPFSLMKTMEFDVELTAPVDIRVLQINFDVDYSWKLFDQQWFYKVQVMKVEQLQILMSQEQYEKSNKFISHPGITM